MPDQTSLAEGVRIGADVGGTFTDIVVERPDGTAETTKLLTTAEAPERAILDGIDRITEAMAVDPGEIVQVLHGTTLATNALIERRGAHTALVTTAGFRDVIETRTESRFEQYDLNIVLPGPLIERYDRLVVEERLDASGRVLVPFDDDSADEVIDEIGRRGYESVAVGFLHSYRNPAHERRFRDRLVAALPDVAVSLSCEVSPQMREYERFSTVAVNAYVQPLMASYLVRLGDELARRGVAGPLYLIHSGGGLMSVASAARFPVRLVESGPAGGAIFAADLAARYRRDRVLSFDMGGTTAKISLIEQATPATAASFEVDRRSRFKKGSGMPISVPVIEMIEIGAGGGSIATVDSLRQIRVGPASAGSDPGPAAYGRGGTAATVTDANLELGRLHPATFGASDIDLSPTLATEAVDVAVAEPLGLDTLTAAQGIAEVVDENMTNAARVHAVENGKDLTGFMMIAFGGGAPLHAARLLDKLGLDELLVPAGAAVGSAIGFLRAPFSYEAVRSFYTTTDDFDVAGANRIMAELGAEAERFVREGTSAPVTVERQVSMRYAGQGWEIPVRLPDVPPGEDVFDEVASDRMVALFTKVYQEFFGRAIDGLRIEAVSWSVRVSSVEPAPEVVDLSPRPDRWHRPRSSRPLFDPAVGIVVEAAVVERDGLEAGEGVAGPALIVEPQTTTVLGRGHRAVVQPDRSLLIRHHRGEDGP